MLKRLALAIAIALIILSVFFGNGDEISFIPN